MARTFDLTKGSIPGHFRRMAVPTAIGMVFTTLYNVVDSYFAGLISTNALAALSLSFQIFFMLVTIGFGVNAAMGALVGGSIGASQRGQARRLACQGLSLAISASVILAILGFLLKPWILMAVSEPGPYRVLAEAYLQVLLIATPSFLVAFAANGILTAQGDAVSMQRCQIAAFFANLGLNPLLIYGIDGILPAMGFNGIATSTLLSQTGVMIFILYRVMSTDLVQGCRPADFRPRLRDFRLIAMQALPTSAAMMVMMFGAFIVQVFLKSFGPESIAAYGIGLRIEQLLLLPGFGLTIALLPIASQNFGAAQYDRVREAFRFCCIAGICLMLLAACLLWFAAKPAIAIFTDDPEVIRHGSNYLNVDGFILPVYLLLFAMNSLLQALKRPIWTLWIGIYRQGLGIAIFTALYLAVLDIGTWAVWFGIATSVLTGFLLAALVTARVARREIGGLIMTGSSTTSSR